MPSKGRLLAKALNSTSNTDVITFNGNAAIKLPNGTTNQRPDPETGMTRYNSTLGVVEVYDSLGWTAIAASPLITTISPTTYDGTSGSSFTITGSNFDQYVTAKFITNTGAEYSAASVTRNSASSLTITTPQNFTVENEPLSVKVINGTGLSYVLDSAIDCGGIPTWNNSAGLIATCYDIMRSGFTTQITATDPESGSVTYSIISGSVPSGMSFNTSTGLISGTPNAVVSDTTSTFTVRATDNAGNTSDRQFSIVIKAPITQVFNYTGSDQTFNIPNGLTSFIAKAWGAGGGAWSSGPSGGAGGYVTATIDTSNLSSLLIVVGPGGEQLGSGTTGYGGVSYAGGGGAGAVGYAGRGGGLSGIFVSSYTQVDAIIVAAGGGGGGAYSTGGGGGGVNGQDGGTTTDGQRPGLGATQSAGGQGGYYGATSPYQGIALTGGSATTGGDSGGGGGGGGGYFGGGAGFNGDSPTGNSGGGGGSSYYGHSRVITGSTLAANLNIPGNQSDSDRGTAGQAGPGQAGTSGKIVIRY